MSSIPIIYGMCIVLFCVGLYGLVTKKNVVKVIISILIMENAVNMFILLLGYKAKGIAPILKEGMEVEKFSAAAVDPLSQTMALTSIAIGLAMVALMVAIAIRIYERFGTFDISEMKDLKK